MGAPTASPERKEHIMPRIFAVAVATVGAVFALGAGLGSADAYAADTPQCPKPPEFDADNFAGDEIDNPYFPLEPGTTYIYEGESDGDPVKDVFEVTNDTKVILGVTTIVVHDQFYVDGELTEDTFDWFAQDEDGNVWYFGEDTKELDPDTGEVVSTEGSWEAGVDGAKPGIFMPADSEVGDVFKQEHAKGVAEDCFEIVDLDASIETPYVDSDEAMETREFSKLDRGVIGKKWFVPNVGMVREEDPEGFLELVKVK
jgi:hypothetical protein